MHSLGVDGESGRQQLESNATTQLRVLRQVHFAHPAFAEPLDDSVMADRLTQQCPSQRTRHDCRVNLYGGPFDEALRLLVRQHERLNLGAQLSVAAAHFTEVGRSLLCWKVKRGLENLLNTLKVCRRHSSSFHLYKR